jgi:hypothetical protein
VILSWANPYERQQRRGTSKLYTLSSLLGFLLIIVAATLSTTISRLLCTMLRARGARSVLKRCSTTVQHPDKCNYVEMHSLQFLYQHSRSRACASFLSLSFTRRQSQRTQQRHAHSASLGSFQRYCFSCPRARSSWCGHVGKERRQEILKALHTLNSS